MSSPLNFKSQSSGGAYGTHPGSNTNGKTRQRRNPGNYGLFSSPHASFDDPTSFPPYAELPFTSLKRRRELQDNNSFVKWVMRGVLLSPVVVLVLWSIAAVTFANNHHIGHSTKKTNINTTNRKQQERNRRMLPNLFGIRQDPVFTSGAPQLQMQDQQGNLIYNVNGNAMMMAPQQIQQQLEGAYNGQPVQSNLFISNGYQQQQMQQQGIAIPMQPQGNSVPVLSPLGNSMDSNVFATNNNLQQGQQQTSQQALQTVTGFAVAQPQQVFMTNNGSGVVQAPVMAQQNQMSQINLDSSSANAMKPPPMTTLEAPPQFQQLSMEGSDNSKIVATNANMMQQVGGSPVGTQDQLQASPAKQAIYFYDPNDTKISQTGEVLQMPMLVYDGNGKAVPLAELRHRAPIYVQAPLRGSSSASTLIGEKAEGGKVLSSPSTRGASLVAPTPKEASIPMPDGWGTSTAQDQSIIIATVAVMALLVGALSARRLRSKSFLSSCIENENLEDDMAYDDAYTTTAAASGAMGADSSYNTFGGWKGDLEKFDV